jgi:acetate kinase
VGVARRMRLLALNAGSRSHIAKLFAFEGTPPLEPPKPEWEGEDESAEGRFATLLEDFPGDPPDVVVHRFVHPGPELAERIAFRIDAGVRELIERSDLAPSHNPLALEGLQAASTRFAGAAQIGISDVVLGDDAPAVATTYAVPFAWRERFGVRRYGFHGISHRDAIERNAVLCGSDDPARRIVGIHLGSGCSMVAARGGSIVDSTMGMTPLEGLMMGSRSGSIDPGMIFTLVRRGALTLDDIERALSKESGLAGVSGVSPDTREIMTARDSGDERAGFALDLYAYIARKAVGAMAAALGGIDVLSFTGPVGEHVASIRRDICDGLGHLGIAIDDERNRRLAPEGSIGSDAPIGTDNSRVRVHVIRTLEEWAMARSAAALLASTATPS